MRPPNSFEHLLARLQSPTHLELAPNTHYVRSQCLQMICIVQTQPTPRRLELLGRKTLERRLRGDGHEHGQVDGAMREVQRCCPRFGRVAPRSEVVSQSRVHGESYCFVRAECVVCGGFETGTFHLWLVYKSTTPGSVQSNVATEGSNRIQQKSQGQGRIQEQGTHKMSAATAQLDGDVDAIGAHCQMAYCHQLDFLPFRCDSCKS